VAFRTGGSPSSWSGSIAVPRSRTRPDLGGKLPYPNPIGVLLRDRDGAGSGLLAGNRPTIGLAATECVDPRSEPTHDARSTFHSRVSSDRPAAYWVRSWGTSGGSMLVDCGPLSYRDRLRSLVTHGMDFDMTELAVLVVADDPTDDTMSRLGPDEIPLLQ
jgi:hypothetical protein